MDTIRHSKTFSLTELIFITTLELLIEFSFTLFGPYVDQARRDQVFVIIPYQSCLTIVT